MTRRLAALRSSRIVRLHASPHPAFDRMRFLFTMSEIEGRKEQRRRDSLSPAIRPSSRQALARSTKLINCIGKDRNTSICSTLRQDQEVQTWWSQTGSNRRPHACKARALPTELWPRLKTRRRPRAVVGLGGLEPPTSRLSSARSNQLSYKPGRRRSPRPPMLLKQTEAQGFHILRSERETKAARSRKRGLTKTA
jgi:hypothetical protein